MKKDSYQKHMRAKCIYKEIKEKYKYYKMRSL